MTSENPGAQDANAAPQSRNESNNQPAEGQGPEAGQTLGPDGQPRRKRRRRRGGSKGPKDSAVSASDAQDGAELSDEAGGQDDGQADEQADVQTDGQQAPPARAPQPRPARPANSKPAPAKPAPAKQGLVQDRRTVAKNSLVEEDSIDLTKAPKFKALGLRDSVMRGLIHAGFEEPTDIQAQLIPEVLAGHDVIGQAKTGTGKTAAFGLPFLNSANKDVPMQALILVPTRELAAQLSAEIDMLARFTPIRSTHIVGGESMRHQSKAIKSGAHILVGTPGRIMDMKERGEIHFHNISYVVLDEVDRMFDIGFREDIRKILKQIQTEHQTVFVSATMTEDVERLARTYMKPDTRKIVTFDGALTVKQVEQRYVAVEAWDKKQMLLHILRKEKPAAAVVFCQTKANVHRIAEYLKQKGIDAHEIHGDLAQSKRNQVMESMRTGKVNVLVASDLAARGLDIDHISHVINYDLPEDPDIYVHRIGRTARAGRDGKAWSLVTSEQGQRLTEIEKLTGALVERMFYEDFEFSEPPADVQLSRQKQQNRPDPLKTLAERSGPVANVGGTGGASPYSDYTPEQLKAMFPDGKIPASLPKRTLGSRFKTHRR